MRLILNILMHLIPVCLLTIEGKKSILKIRRVQSIELAKDGNAVGTVATVKMAGNAFYNGQPLDLPTVITRGDKVTLDLGFDTTLVREFIGFVGKVKPGYPLEIEIEDGFYRLRRVPCQGDFKSISLKNLLAKILPKDMAFESLEVEIGNFTAKKSNVASVLAKIHAEHKIQFWFTPEGKLIAGRLNSYQQSGKPKYIFRHGINLVKNDLEYLRAEDLTVKLKGINHVTGEKNKKLEMGEDGGDTLTRNYFNLSDAGFKAALKRDYESYKVDGFRGGFTALGLPSVQPGDIVEAQNLPFSELTTATAFCEKFTLKFDSNGYFREIGIGGKAINRS